MMSRAWMALLSLFVAVCATPSTQAVSLPAARPKPSDPAAKIRPPLRFEIRHRADGKPGPLTSPDGSRTVKVLDDLTAQVVEAKTGAALTPALKHSRRRDEMRLTTWAFSADGRLLATASSAGDEEDTVGEVRVWEAATGKLVAEATDAQFDLGRVHGVAFSRDNTAVVIYCQEISGK